MLPDEQIQELASKHTGGCVYPTPEPFGWVSMGQIRFTPPTYDHGTYTAVYTSPHQKDYEQELEAIVKQYKEYIVGLETKAYTEISRLRAENATLSEKLDNLSK